MTETTRDEPTRPDEPGGPAEVEGFGAADESRLRVHDAKQAAAGVTEVWTVSAAKSDDVLRVLIHARHEELSHDLGVDPGLIKDGVEADLQRLLAEQLDLVSTGTTLVRREFPTAIGPVDQGLGLLFGVGRGVLLVVVALIVEILRRRRPDGPLEALEPQVAALIQKIKD